MIPALRYRLLLFTGVGFGLLAPMVWAFYWPADTLFDVSKHPLGVDFANIWAAPRIAAQHGVMTLYEYADYFTAFAGYFGSDVSRTEWSYPPTMLLFAKPMSLLPYRLALIIYTLAGLTLYAVVVLRRLAPETRSFALLILLLAPATMINVVVGQNGFFTAVLVLGGISLIERRPWVAGILFGLFVAKPHIAILLPIALVAIGAWRTIVSTCATSVVFIAASLLIWGLDPWIAWWTKTCAHIYYLLARFELFHTYMMPSVFGSVRALGLSAETANVVQILVALPVAVATAWAFRTTRDVALRGLVLASGALLVSPYVFNYDMTAVTAAMLWVMLRSGREGENKTWHAFDGWIFGAAWVLPGAIWWLRFYSIDIWSLVVVAVLVSALVRIYQAAPARAVMPTSGVASRTVVSSGRVTA
jgi:uncharacterized membrane protein YiaA